MPLFKRNPFGHYLFLKKWLIRVFGVISHGRYRKFNNLQIDGSEIIRSLPDKNVLFISNHQTYFADVAAMFHVFNASLSGRDDNIKNIGYIWNPKLNIYYVAAGETMRAGLLPKIFAYAGSVSIDRTWRSEGKDVNRQVKNSDISNVSDTTQIKDELLKLLHGFNFTAELNTLVKGKSGNMHEIPIFGKSKSNDDSILIFIKNQSSGVDESDMNSILIPKLDIDPKNTLLVTVSDVKDGVENLAKHYGINLISDPDFSKIISRVEEFVSAWYANDGGRK